MSERESRPQGPDTFAKLAQSQLLNAEYRREIDTYKETQANLEQTLQQRRAELADALRKQNAGDSVPAANVKIFQQKLNASNTECILFRNKTKQLEMKITAIAADHKRDRKSYKDLEGILNQALTKIGMEVSLTGSQARRYIF